MNNIPTSHHHNKELTIEKPDCHHYDHGIDGNRTHTFGNFPGFILYNP
jgi:hypothetical protein